MNSKQIEDMLTGVNQSFRQVRSGIYGEWEDGDEVIFLDGGKDLDESFLYSISFDQGYYETSVQEAESMDPVKRGKHKTVKGVINFIKKWDRENAF